MLVSIIMPTYNAEMYICDAIQSILEQTHSDWELIVVDGGSDDKTIDILMAAQKADTRITIHKRNGMGLSDSLNLGVEKARGDFIARMDGDDISHSNRLEKQLEYLIKNKVDIVGCHYHAIDNSNRIIDTIFVMDKPDLIKLQLLFGVPFAHGSVLFRKNIFNNDELKYDRYLAEDYSLWCKMMSNNLKFGNVPDFLYRWRRYPESLTKVNNKRTLVAKYKISKDWLKEDHAKLFNIYNRYLQKYEGSDDLSASEKEVILISVVLYSIMSIKLYILARVFKKYITVKGIYLSLLTIRDYIKYGIFIDLRKRLNLL
jgi:glycosyltransferase involved in cell wall biosynthesis